ncbi:MAG: hypothetical protein RBS80_06425 [Thermoguttaceae bacterium]|jgi:hydrogenase maturation factor|nr:hypothetical protein [Thermoguttaceae bacterium]
MRTTASSTVFRFAFARLLGPLLLLLTPALLYGAELQVGAASVDITPPKAVALWGQFGLRLSTKPDTPLTANVVALRSADVTTTFVSLDLLQLPEVFVKAVRDAVAAKDATIDASHIVLTATHTHTAPVLRPGTPGIPVNEQTMTVEETIAFLADKISDGIVAAWKNVAPGKVSYGLDRNSIGFSRRVVYANGSARMYGNTNQADFVCLEGMDDDDVGTIFFFDQQDKLKAIIVNVACPSQVVEGQSAINADYWLPVRDCLKARYGEDTVVLGWSSAAGDMSPRPLVHKAANARMRALRGINEMQELARRIDLSVSQTFDAVQKEKIGDPVLKHAAVTLQLPISKISEAQYQEALAAYNNVLAQVEKDPSCASRVAFMAQNWHHGVVRRYEQLQKDPGATYPVEIHVVRLGDLVVCTNPFELFCEYGIRIKARSQATQTFIVQMSGFGSYLPTERALAGGHYSAVPQSNIIGPEGGQMLVDKTVEIIQELWK